MKILQVAFLLLFNQLILSTIQLIKPKASALIPAFYLLTCSFGNQNGYVQSVNTAREIHLLILVHRDSEGKQNLPEALAKAIIR